MDIAAWLTSLGLERYKQAFDENEIDFAVLPRLTGDDLKDMVIPTPVLHAPLYRATRQIAGRSPFRPLESRRPHASNPHRAQRRYQI